MEITSVKLNQLYQSIKPKLRKLGYDVSEEFDIPDSKIKLKLHIPRDSHSATLFTVNTHNQVKVNFGFNTEFSNRNLFTALDCIFKLLPSYTKTINNQDFEEIHQVDIGDNEIEHKRKSRDDLGIPRIYPYEKGKEPKLEFSFPDQDDTFYALAV